MSGASDHSAQGGDGAGGGDAQARGKRNLALALALVAFVVLIFAVTVARLRGDMANSWNYEAPTEAER